MTESIHQLLESLPEASLTTHVLGALDYIVPGEWQNIVRFDQMIQSVTGDSDEALTQQVGEKAIALWFDESLGYQRAAQVFQWVDSGSTVAGAAALANMAGARFDVLSFLTDVTPKSDTTQAIDAGVKLAAELTAFCLSNGFPGDSVGDFASAIVNAGKEEKMRLAAWLALDCVLPLGPDFLRKVMDAVHAAEESELQNNRVFRFIADRLPGDMAAKKNLLLGNMESAGSYLNGFATDQGVTQDSIQSRIREYIDIADDKLDIAAAAIDLSTNYFEHTGIQTVARRVIGRAYAEI